MPAALSTYLRLVRASFAAQRRYLAASLAGMFTNVIFGFLRAAILTATVAAAGGVVAGYDRASMLTYVWIGQAIYGVVQVNAAADIGERIRTGDIAVDFARPLDVQAAHLAADVGRNLFGVPIRAVPTIAVATVTTGLLLPTGALPYLAGALSVPLAMVCSFASRYAINAVSFWIIESRGLRVLYMAVSTFLCGLFAPVGLFPEWLRTLAYATPFPSMVQTPIDILSGRTTSLRTVELLGQQLFWAVALLALGRLLTARGRAMLQVQGG